MPRPPAIILSDEEKNDPRSITELQSALLEARERNRSAANDLLSAQALERATQALELANAQRLAKSEMSREHKAEESLLEAKIRWALDAPNREAREKKAAAKSAVEAEKARKLEHKAKVREQMQALQRIEQDRYVAKLRAKELAEQEAAKAEQDRRDAARD